MMNVMIKQPIGLQLMKTFLRPADPLHEFRYVRIALSGKVPDRFF
tara:strand:- start:430 stop:564 length:135 start_codon:yes stop_codon:yes gene_type:complete